MAVAPSMKGLFYLKQQSAVGTPATGFVDADILWANAAVPALTQEAIRSEQMRPGYGAPPIVAGNKDGDTSLEMPFHGWSAATPTGDVVPTTDMLLALHAFGATGTTDFDTGGITGGTTTTLIGPTQQQGLPLLVDMTVPSPTSQAFAWNDGGNDIAVPMPSTPLVGGNQYGAYVAVVAVPGAAALNPLTLQWLGADASTAVRFFDAVVTSYVATFDSRTQPKVSATLRHLDWINDGSGGAPASPDPSAVLPELPRATDESGARLYINGAERCVGPFSLNVANTFAVRECHTTSEQLIANRVITVEFTGTQADLGTAWNVGETVTNVQLDLCTTPGRALSLYIPLMVVTGPESPVPRNGLLNTTVTLEAVDDGTNALAALAWA